MLVVDGMIGVAGKWSEDEAPKLRER